MGGRRLAKAGKAPLASVDAAVYSSSIAKKSNWSDGSTEADILLEEDFSGFTAAARTRPTRRFWPTTTATLACTSTRRSPHRTRGQDATSIPQGAGWPSSHLTNTRAPPRHPARRLLGRPHHHLRVKALVNSDLFVNLLKGGYAEADDATTKNKGNSTSYRIYASQGWRK
jgi:hypothetical protein